MQEAQAWLNGKYCAFSKMQLPVWDLGVVAGASLTEMARTFAHKPFRLAKHLQRLLSSCDELGFAPPWSPAELLTAAQDVIEKNVSLIRPGDDLGIVMFSTAGANRTYLGDAAIPGPTVGIHTFPLPFALWQPSIRNGVRLQIPSMRQIESDQLPVHLKTRNRLHWWLADKEADAIESGSRALLLDGRGFVTETSTACFFGVLNDQVVTPRAHVLNSMSRRIVAEAVRAAGISFREADISVDDVQQMQDCFLTSTPVGVLPVQSIGDQRFTTHIDSPRLMTIRRYWQSQTGVDPAMQILQWRRDSEVR